MNIARCEKRGNLKFKVFLRKNVEKHIGRWKFLYLMQLSGSYFRSDEVLESSVGDHGDLWREFQPQVMLVQGVFS